jgi:hypothetical protein
MSGQQGYPNTALNPKGYPQMGSGSFLKARGRGTLLIGVPDLEYGSHRAGYGLVESAAAVIWPEVR